MARTDLTFPVLVLLPGLLCDAAVWADQCAGLADVATCQVVHYGLRDSIEAMAAQVLETVPAARFALAGHSMGGRVALEVLRQAPDRVERLALLDTGFQSRPPGAAGEGERASRLSLLATARADGMRAMGRDWAPGMVHPEQLAAPVFERILDMIDRSSPEAFESQIRALLDRPDATDLLPRIACPTLLLCGRQDAWSPLARHEQMRDAIPAARLEVVEACGHMSTMERPREVTEAMKAWLAPQ